MSDIMIIVMSVIYINKEDKILICTKTVLLKYLTKSNIVCNDLSWNGVVVNIIARVYSSNWRYFYISRDHVSDDQDFDRETQNYEVITCRKIRENVSPFLRNQEDHPYDVVHEEFLRLEPLKQQIVDLPLVGLTCVDSYGLEQMASWKVRPVS